LSWCKDLAPGRLTLVSNGTWQSDGPDGPSGAAPTEGKWKTRQELVSVFAGPPITEELLDRATAVLESLPNTDAEVIQVMGDTLRKAVEGPVDEETAFRLSLLAMHPAAREVAMFTITTDSAAMWTEKWTEVVRQAPPAGPEALLLLGLAGYVSGNGALAATALSLVDEAVPLATIVGGLVDGIVSPHDWDALSSLMLEASGAVRDQVMTVGGV